MLTVKAELSDNRVIALTTRDGFRYELGDREPYTDASWRKLERISRAYGELTEYDLRKYDELMRWLVSRRKVRNLADVLDFTENDLDEWHEYDDLSELGMDLFDKQCPYAYRDILAERLSGCVDWSKYARHNRKDVREMCDEYRKECGRIYARL